jgi:hypothetical protein
VEERIIMRAAEKLFLDAMIVQQAYHASTKVLHKQQTGRHINIPPNTRDSRSATHQGDKHSGLSATELLGMLTFGAEKVGFVFWLAVLVFSPRPCMKSAVLFISLLSVQLSCWCFAL